MPTAQIIVNGAYKFLRVKKLGYDIVDDELTDGIEELNDMMVAWDAMGRPLGYQKATNGEDELGTPDWANIAIKSNLAIILSAISGQTIHPALPTIASKSLKAIDTFLQQIKPIGFPTTLPVGAGNHPLYYNRSQYFRNPLANDLEAIGGGPLTDEEGFSLDLDFEDTEEKK